MAGSGLVMVFGGVAVPATIQQPGVVRAKTPEVPTIRTVQVGN